MQGNVKKEKILEFVRHGIDLYLSQNVDKLGFLHIIDVNMSEDLKTAFVYIACPVEKNAKKLENSIVKDRHIISEIFKSNFSSKYTPKLKIICLKETDVEF